MSRWTPDKALLDAVATYVAAGWPILPLSPAADQVVSGLVPPDVETALDWWSDRPYGIACRIGELFDVIELPHQRESFCVKCRSGCLACRLSLHS